MPATAPVTVRVPSMLRNTCGQAPEIEVAARDVRAALAEIERRHPALYRSVCDETGAVRRHVNLFVNNDHVRDVRGIDSPLAPGDVLTIHPAVSGG